MHRNSTLQKPDEQFLAQAHTIDIQCNGHKTEWKIDASRLADLDALLATAAAAYTANSDKATKNAITSANKKVAFGELKHFLGMFINYLEANLDVPDAALEFMGLRPRQHHAYMPKPRPDKKILLSIIKQHDEMTIYAALPELGHPTASVGPSEYHGFIIRHKLEGEEKYQTVVSTRLHHTLFFDHADEGKRVLISAAWVNPRLEPGPWSDEISEIIG